MKSIIQVVLTFVLNALWQGTLVVAFAAVGDRLLRGIAPRFRHYLWVFTLFACLIIPALSSVSVPNWARFPGTAQSAPSLGPIPVVTSRIITPGIEDISHSPTEAPRVEQNVSISRSITVARSVALAIVSLYGLIVLWRLVALLRAWNRTNRIVAGAFVCEFSDWLQERITQCQSEVGVKSCRVLCSNDIAVPITVGVFDRLVILPQRFTREVNLELLTSALGHEFQHVARHDYLLNLIYEFIYLPLSFHPAAAFVRRRIRHTRELCCDAAVTNRLISPEVYARSLVRLIGSAPILPLAPDTTIGMNESDILEVRIMALLKKSNLSARRRLLLLAAASLLLAVPCVAAARFGLSFETAKGVAQAEPNVPQMQQQKKERAEIEKGVVRLEAEEKNLKQLLELTPQAKKDERAELQAKLQEVERNLTEHRRALEFSQLSVQDSEMQKLKQLMEQYEKGQLMSEARLKEYEQLLVQAKLRSPNELEELRQTFQRMAAEQAASQGDRKPRLLSHLEARYADDAREKGIEGRVVLGFTVDHNGIPQGIQIKRSLYPSLDQAAIEAVRGWRFEPAMKNGQVVSMWMEASMDFTLYQDPQKREERGWAEKEMLVKELLEKAQFEGQEVNVRRVNEAKRRAEGLAEQKRDAILADMAKISMDHAIQIATSKVPGKVTSCSLVGERWDSSGESAKPTMVLYHVVVLTDGVTVVKNHVLINAMDGSVVSVKQEDKREEEEMVGYARIPSEGAKRAINGGVLNGKALSLPAPSYPAIARAAHASGPVNIQVLIDEGGNVIEAAAISGHPLLRAAAMAAAKEAKFAPTRLSGEPVNVTGILVFNFVEQ